MTMQRIAYWMRVDLKKAIFVNRHILCKVTGFENKSKRKDKDRM